MFQSPHIDPNPTVLQSLSSADTLAAVFKGRCAALDDKLAYGFLRDDLSLVQSSSYSALETDVNAIAAWLGQMTRPGDRVLLAFPAGLDFVRVFWACMVSGRVAVPVPAPDPIRMHHAAPRLRSVIADSRAALVLTSPGLLDAASAALDPGTFTMARWVALPETLPPAANPRALAVAIEPDALAYIQYTSGSTSTPRGVRLSHANVLANAHALALAFQCGPDTRALNWLPHFHDYGLVCGVVTPMVVGGTSYLMSPLTFLRRPLRWLEAVDVHQITHTGAPESAFATIAQALVASPLEARLDSLVSLSCGAEPIRADTVEKLLSALGPAGLRPEAFTASYGLAEAVLGVSANPLDMPPRIVEARAAALMEGRFEPEAAGAPHGRRLVGCGRALEHTEIVIVDPASTQPQAQAHVGEIWVRSPSVGGGYWMHPEDSAQVFGAFLTDGRGPYLRTGDLGFLDDGQLFVTGRLKDLIIIHGENHYPQDLEWTAERTHAALRPGHAAAFAVDTPDGEAVVLALEIDRRQTTPDVPSIYSEVRRALALEHGVPVQTVALVRAGGLPRTSSGKVQRQACRNAFLAGELPLFAALDSDQATTAPLAHSPARPSDPPARTGFVAPRNANEQAVWDIFSEVLGTRAFGVQESFFELGGNSLRMTQVLSRLHARFDVEMPLGELFEHASVAALASELAARLDGATREDTASSYPAIEHVDRSLPVPTSLSQRRMWVIQTFDPASTAYNVPIAIRLRGAFDPVLCQLAFDAMLQRHEGLRTALVLGDNEPMQSILPRISVPIELIDLRHLPEPARSTRARELLAHRLAQPFDLAVAPLHRPTLIRLDEREHVLFWLLHHAITDNWAGALLMREALSAYGALADGRKPATEPPSIGYADYAAWQRSPASAQARQPHLAYWTDRLRDLPDLDLPTDFHRPAKASFKGARTSADLPPRLREAVRQFAGREAVTPFVVFLSAFALMLSRHAKSEDIPIGTPIANRHRFASEQLVGTLVNTLVMRTDLSGDPSFTQLVHRVRKNALEAYAHQDAPFDELIDALGHDRTLRPQGPVRVLFNVLNAPVGELDFFGLEVDEFDFDRTAAQFDLSVHVDTEFAHRIHLEYATDLFTATSAARMLENYLSLVEHLLAEPERALSTFELVSPAQMSLMRHHWNGTQVPLAGPLLIHRYVGLDAPEVRERTAVVDSQGRALSFGNVDEASNRLARALRARGIARGHRVGLCIERSPDMLIAQLAVMKAGAAYVPLDPEYPADRLRYMALDAELSAVLVHSHVSAILEGLDLPLLALEDPGLTSGHSALPLAPDAGLDATPTDDAYVIYTSGSTGQPKGVRVPHRGVVNFLEGFSKRPGLCADDCLVAITSPSFDPSVLDLMLPLRVRAKLVIASHAQGRDPVALRGLLEEHQATLLQATPSAWRMLIDAGWMGTPTFRALIGGEPLPPVLAERLMERTAELWNIYGPTETTVWATAWKVQSPRHGVAIGTPTDNTTVWVLDDHGHASPIGVPGELFIGGAGVTAGYYNRPELTAERFVPDPFSDHADGRLYRTGDLGRWRHDGLLEHLGRADHQVKLRGHRIELGEIESALLDHPHLAHCVAVTREESEEDVRLVAYYVPRIGTFPGAVELRDHLRTRLPQYMIPQHFVALEAMPQLPNGKVNRAALPAPVYDNVLADGRNYLPPTTETERAIASIWQELLGIAQVGRTDNFFDLGGHSLLAMRAVTAIDSTLGWKVTPRRLIFESLQQIARPENV